MSRIRLLRLLSSLIVATAVLLLPSGVAGRVHLQQPTATIYPVVQDVLRQQAEVEVFIALRQLDIPLAQQTTEVSVQHAAAVQAKVLSVLAPGDFKLTHQYAVSPALVGRITQSGVSMLATHPDVTSVEIPAKGQRLLSQSVPMIKADLIHNVGYDGTGINVAVIDSGVEADHPDLMSSIVQEMCYPQFTSCGPPDHVAEDVVGHGTLVTGVITSDGEAGVAPTGVSPGAAIYAYKDGDADADARATLKALEDIESRPVDFVNISTGFDELLEDPATCSTTPQGDLIKTQVDRLLLFRDVLTFAGSGNSGSKSTMAFPACHSSVVSVGAVYDSNVSFADSGGCPAPREPDEVWFFLTRQMILTC